MLNITIGTGDWDSTARYYADDGGVNSVILAMNGLRPSRLFAALGIQIGAAMALRESWHRCIYGGCGRLYQHKDEDGNKPRSDTGSFCSAECKENSRRQRQRIYAKEKRERQAAANENGKRRRKKTPKQVS